MKSIVEKNFALRLGVWALSMGSGLGCDAQVDNTYLGEPLVTVNGRVESELVSTEGLEVGVLWLTFGDPTDSDWSPDPITRECEIEFVDSEPTECESACGDPGCEDSNQLDQWLTCIDACPGEPNLDVRVEESVLVSGGVGQTTPVAGSFPAQFSLDILEPPPAEALISFAEGEPQLAIGLFVALDPDGAPWELSLAGGSGGFPDWLQGGSGSHALFYSPEGFPIDSALGQFLGESLDAGFQMVELIEIPEPSSATNDEGNELDEKGFQKVPSGDATQIVLEIADPATINWPLPTL